MAADLEFSIYNLEFKFWSGRTDSNRRPSPWQGDVLPTELLPPDCKLTNLL